ncbi:hypothetical protein [Priestia koreensis]|uniref:hypothetical protein n=1 Tax=Priestia koreensis TaxID=284581 RepID=UPI00203F654A|nr:hypothetical protein [Priestia koreensis]MCM3006955.1 hypothetical protein [Priestia koreensis]
MDHVIKNLDLHSDGTWVAILLSLLLFFYAIFMPKSIMTWREFYITFGVVGYGAWIADSIIGKMLDLVDYGNPNITGIGEFLSYSLIPSSLAVIHFNYFHTTNRWIIGSLFALFSTLIEWILIQVGYENLHGWGFWISIPIYLIVFLFALPIHYRFIQKRW